MKKLSLIALLLVLILILTGCGENKGTTSPIKDCKEDFSCFISATETCTDAKVNYKATINVFDVLQEVDSSYELKKSDDGRCMFSFITNDIKLQYSEDLLKKLKDGGSTQAQIDQQLQQSSIQYKPFINKEGRCVGDTEIISALFIKWEKGSYSTKDWDNLTCSGPYFDQINVGSFFGKS